MIDRRNFLKAVSGGAVNVAMASAGQEPSVSPGTLVPTSPITGQVDIDTRTIQHTVDRRIYGHFMEHIGRVIHQGLWADLLRNRKFYPVDPQNTQVADPWRPEVDRTQVSYVIDQALSLNGISSQRVTLFGKSHEWRGISQTGFNVLGGQEYVAYAWVKAAPSPKEICFQLTTKKGEVSAHGAVALQSQDWRKYEVRLKPGEDLSPAVFKIGFNSPGIAWIGAASLMPADNMHGMRRDVLEMFRLLGPTIFRWPGGCYADSYDWRKAIGPRDRRPPVPIIPLGYPDGYNHGMDPNDFGTDEFLQLCKVTGAEPYINANFGMGTAEEAAAWVEYCNGSRESKWGAVRASNGHPEPYGVRQWAIGNEVYGSPYESGHTTAEGYSTYYVPMAQAMRAVDPSIRITAVGGFSYPVKESDWNLPFLTSAWQQVDFLSLHHYYPSGFWPPELMNRCLPQYLAVVSEPTKVADKIREIIALIDQTTQGKKKIQIAFDEWNEFDWNYPMPEGSPSRAAFINYFIDLIRKTSLEFNQTHRDGLYGARMLHNFMRFGDRITIAVRTHPINSLAAMHTDSTRVFMTASGKMMQLYRQHSGTRFLQTATHAPTFDFAKEGYTGVSCLDAITTQSSDGRRIFVHLLNLHPSEAMETRIQIKGRGLEQRGDAWQIAPEDFMARNDFGVTNVDIKHSTLQNITSNFNYRLPPHSATILEIRMR